MKKRGAIELSIGAIIILIISIVVLALILAFVRGMFSTVITNTEAEIGKEPDPWPATASEPITLSREKIVTHVGEDEVLKVQFYNGGTAGDYVPSASCTDPDVITNPRVMTQNVASGNVASYNYLFTVGSVSVNSYICRATIGSKLKDIEIQVIS